MARCPNKNLKGWKSLVGKVGEYEAMSLYMRNDENTPNLGRDLKIPASGIVSYNQKIKILTNLRAYNSKLGTKHRLNFLPTGESYEGKREYTYVVTLDENWNRTSGDQLSMFQDSADKTEERNERIDDKMRVFLQTIGVEYKAVNEITDREGKPLGFTAKANMLNKVVEVVEKRAGVDTLPEEAAHFFVNILEAQGDPLASTLLKNIDKYKIYDEVVANPNYQEYSEEMLRKEAAGKAIAKHIIDKDHEGEFSENISTLERIWNKIIAKIKKFFNIPTQNPYARAALAVLNNELEKNSVNLMTEDQVELGDFYQDSPQDMQKNVVELLDNTEEDLFKTEIDNEELKKTMKAKIDLPEGKQTSRYKSASRGAVRGRVSDMSQEKLVKKRGVDWVREMNSKPANEHKRTQGTFHHETMQHLVEYYSGNVERTTKGFEAMKLRATRDPNNPDRLIMSDTQFAVLVENVKSIVKEIKDTQKKVNKEKGTVGEVIIRTEAMVYAPQEDRKYYYADTAGTIDVVAIFSDGSTSIYDWKFMSPGQVSGYGQKAKIMQNPFTQREDGYNMQIGAYKSILKHFYNVKKIRRTRIVPVHIQYKWSGNPGAKTMTPVIDTLKMALDIAPQPKGKYKVVPGDPHLSQIPVASELSDFTGLNKILEERLQHRSVLKNRLDSEKNAEKKQALKYKIEKIDNAIKQIQLKGDIYDLFADAGANIKELEERLSIQDQEDPGYIQLEELLDFYKEMARASLLAGDSTEFLANLGNTNEEKALKKRVTSIMDRWARPIDTSLALLRDEMASRVQGLGDAAGIANNTRAQREFGLLEWFVQKSASSHPIFQTAYDYINRASNTVRKAEKETYNEIEALLKDIETKWGNRRDAFDLLVNEETGNLHPMIKKEFWEAKNKAFEEGDVKWVKKHYKLKEDAVERYKNRKKKAYDNIDKNFKDYEAIYGKDSKIDIPRRSQEQTRNTLKENWERLNNPNSDVMWVGPSSYIYTDLKTTVAEDNYSEAYLRIRNSEPLLNFYEYYQKKNREFAEVTGMQFADNFVANIHRDAIDSLSEGRFSAMSVIKGFNQSLQVRQDEITPEMTDENGDLIRSIPILYTSPGMLIDPETGEINLKLKSNDLGKSLHLMANSVYNYVEKTKIESINLALLAYLQDDKTIVLPTDTEGNLITNMAGKLATKIGSGTASDHFERLYVKSALYNQGLQSKDAVFFGKYSMNKTVMQLKTWYSANTLGFGIVPALAAGVAGGIATWIESKKASMFNTKGMHAAEKAMVVDRKKSEAINNYFEIWQENMTTRRSIKLTTGKLARYVDLDSLFTPFRVVDNTLDNTTLNAMMRFWGVGPDGKAKRLSELPEGSKSLLEEFTVDEEVGTVTTGLSEEGENNFREKVQWATSSIKGSMRDDDASAFDTTLIGKLVMTFKSWLPRVLQERAGKFRYNDIIDAYENGRYRVAASEYIHTEGTLLDNMQNTIKSVVKLAISTGTFGFYKGDPMNEKRAEKEYHQFKMDNLDDPDIQNMQKEQYYEMKRGQLRAWAAELKGLFGLFIVLMALGAENDEGEIIANQTYVGRKLHMVLQKTMMELSFMLNPTEFTSMFKSPLPLIGFAVDLQKAGSNFFQESWNLINGTPNKRDKSPLMYYTWRLVPGFRQMSRWVELRETDKVSPYNQSGR